MNFYHELSVFDIDIFVNYVQFRSPLFHLTYLIVLHGHQIHQLIKPLALTPSSSFSSIPISLLQALFTSSNNPSFVNTSTATAASPLPTFRLISNASLVPAAAANSGLCGPCPPSPGGIAKPTLRLGIA
ncbi:hypothetical protein GQ607_004460 [Colletotrichum asianum]|uniref:Uncharacterized protein n=1 Tax=Colletotrichum asianum TaxID=702518 RepID=A0A8H3WPU1_9PEZI|nr:hypothetical protein GQ607_004460 [Colletotrichum asianum]